MLAFFMTPLPLLGHLETERLSDKTSSPLPSVELCPFPIRKVKMSTGIQHSSAQHLILCTYALVQQFFLKQMNLVEDIAIAPKKFRLRLHLEERTFPTRLNKILYVVSEPQNLSPGFLFMPQHRNPDH